MNQYKVTILGSRRAGKTAVAHYMTNQSSFGTHYAPTQKLDLRHIKIDHPDLEPDKKVACSITLEDTPGWRAQRREDDQPDLLEPKCCYVFGEDGVRRPGAEAPEEGEEEEAEPSEATPLTGSELKGVSPIDTKLDRQGFVIVYNILDKDSLKEAELVMSDLVAKMEKPDDESSSAEQSNAPPPDEAPEIPRHPFVVIATHTDQRRNKRIKNIVDREAGEDVAGQFGAPHYEFNTNGKSAKKALEEVVKAIQNVEDNLVFDKQPTFEEIYCVCSCKQCCWVCYRPSLSGCDICCEKATCGMCSIM